MFEAKLRNWYLQTKNLGMLIVSPFCGIHNLYQRLSTKQVISEGSFKLMGVCSEIRELEICTERNGNCITLGLEEYVPMYYTNGNIYPT